MNYFEDEFLYEYRLHHCQENRQNLISNPRKGKSIKFIIESIPYGGYIFLSLIILRIDRNCELATNITIIFRMFIHPFVPLFIFVIKYRAQNAEHGFM